LQAVEIDCMCDTGHKPPTLQSRNEGEGPDLSGVGAPREIMMTFKTVLLASALVAAGSFGALAQSGSSQQRPAGTTAGSGAVSAATHCVDSAGVTRLKSEAQAKGTGSSTSGSASGPSAAGGTASGNAPGGNPGSALPKC
jgi:hypothetical protein